MSVLVDTPLWSLALRRRKRKLSAADRRLVLEFEELIRDGRAEIIGPIRQEVLSGIRSESQFEALREHLKHFPDALLVREDYEEAARCSNVCRRHGIQGTAIDFVICATAIRRGWPVFSTDRDFTRYAQHLAIPIHNPGGRSGGS